MNERYPFWAQWAGPFIQQSRLQQGVGAVAPQATAPWPPVRGFPHDEVDDRPTPPLDGSHGVPGARYAKLPKTVKCRKCGHRNPLRDPGPE
ncbi:hypothetical protein ACWERI_12480 [Streptomyces collinus]